jgi:hypothetical protein
MFCAVTYYIGRRVKVDKRKIIGASRQSPLFPAFQQNQAALQKTVRKLGFLRSFLEFAD